MKKIKIVSGGQTGADRGGLDAAIELNIPHGGFCPKGRKSEDGVIPEIYNLDETTSANYLVRTERNVGISDLTLIFIRGNLTGGSKKTQELCIKHSIPFIVINLNGDEDIHNKLSMVKTKIIHGLDGSSSLKSFDDLYILNIAGNRESKAPGIQLNTKSFLMEILKGITNVSTPETTKIESLDLPTIHVDERPDWDTWFMTLAFIVSQRSLDPSTKHGCIVVDSDRTILSVGYNSPPRGCDDSKIPLTRPEKYDFMEHAESNAINNAARSGTRLKDSTFYITGEPCPACLRKMINVGCSRIVYGKIDSVMLNDQSSKASKLMLDNSLITVVTYDHTEKIFNLLDKCDKYIKSKVKKEV